MSVYCLSLSDLTNFLSLASVFNRSAPCSSSCPASPSWWLDPSVSGLSRMELQASRVFCSLSSSACRLDCARVDTRACSKPGVRIVSGLDMSSCPSCVVSVPSRAYTGRDSDTAALTSSLSPSTSILTLARGYNAVSPWAHSHCLSREEVFLWDEVSPDHCARASCV